MKTTNLRWIACNMDYLRVPLNGSERAEIPGDIPYWGANGVVDYINASVLDERVILIGEDGAPFFDRDKDVAFISEGAAWINNHIHILKPDQRIIDDRFLKYFLNQVDYSLYINGSTRDKLTQSQLGNISVSYPDLATQRQIADFLDRETARIDLLIEKKQRLVALLGEKLQAAISTLVKKGASNPSIRLRHVARLNPSARHLRLEPDALVTFCPMDAIQDGVGGIDTSNTRPISEVASASYNFFAEGDILLAKVTPCFENGKKALARDLMNGVGFATSEVFVVRVDPKKTSPEYLVYLFASDDFQYAGRSSMTGAGGLRRISERSILDFPLFVTDLLQQQEIVREIDNEVGISRTITAKTNASIDRLKEYRSALITAAVTGQIDLMTYAKSGAPDRQLDAIQEEMGA